MTARATFDPSAIVSTLARHGVRFVAIGGWAASVHDAGWPTLDVDIVVARTPTNMAALLAALAGLGAEYDTQHQPPIRPDLARLTTLAGPPALPDRARSLDVRKEAGGEEGDETASGESVAPVPKLTFVMGDRDDDAHPVEVGDDQRVRKAVESEVPDDAPGRGGADEVARHQRSG